MSDYNGWKNYPTWAVHLWLTNEEGSYAECLRTVQDGRRHQPEELRAYVADTLKASHEEASPLEDASVYADLLGYALDTVDWFEIADAFIEE